VRCLLVVDTEKDRQSATNLCLIFWLLGFFTGSNFHSGRHLSLLAAARAFCDKYRITAAAKRF
jgi:hypothetical protein